MYLRVFSCWGGWGLKGGTQKPQDGWEFTLPTPHTAPCTINLSVHHVGFRGYVDLIAFKVIIYSVHIIKGYVKLSKFALALFLWRYQAFFVSFFFLRYRHDFKKRLQCIKMFFQVLKSQLLALINTSCTSLNYLILLHKNLRRNLGGDWLYLPLI